MAALTQAFVLGAGLGTRLRPLTDDLPKPLVPIFQKPLITFALDHLIDIGIRRFIVNTHKLPEEFTALTSYRDHGIKFVNEPVLLETGGGIKNIERDLGDAPFITYSGDILTDVDLAPLLEEHFRRGNDVTLGLRKTGLASAIALRDGAVVDISNRYGIPGEFDFVNVAVWNPSIFQKIPPAKKVSFIPIVGDWIGQGGKIGGVVLGDGKWFNIGSRDEYLDVHRMILREQWKPRYVKDAAWPQQVAPNAIVDLSAQVRGCSVIGAHCRVDTGAFLEDTIVWPEAQIASRAHLAGCIVRRRKTVAGEHRNIDI
ncbi:MAG: mannose-phosphate guanylyltransferase [Verrucomicrobiota bacterium]|jgi:NDP-sugar pyrophosphorylase family protein